MSRIVATQGDGRYLLDCEIEVDGKPQGQIVDTRRGLIFPPMFIGSLLARGHWDECRVDPAEQAAIVSSVAPAEGADHDAVDYYQQALSLLRSWKAGRTGFPAMIEVLKSIPWGSTRPSGDWMAAADVPVTNGPLLGGVLGTAIAMGIIDADESEKIDTALTA